MHFAPLFNYTVIQTTFSLSHSIVCIDLIACALIATLILGTQTPTTEGLFRGASYSDEIGGISRINSKTLNSHIVYIARHSLYHARQTSQKVMESK
jgi:hypothetical protein